MRLEKVKRFIANTIEPKKKAGPVSIIYNILMSLVVIASCVFVFVDLFVQDGSYWDKIADKVEIIAVIIFGVEYLLKLFASEALYEGQGWFKSKISYITSFDSFIDIVCIVSILLNQIPKEFSALRLLKLVKLTRLVKLKDAVDEIREQGDGSSKEKKEKKNIRFRIYQIIYKAEEGDKLSKAYDIVSVIIIILSVGTIVLDTFTFPENVEKSIFIAEVVFAIFFAIEYILRIWTADYEYPHLDKDHAKMRYIFSFLAIIDLLSILPVFFTFSKDAQTSMPTTVAILKIFKIFKITRLLKMSRYLNGVNLFVKAIKKKKAQIFFSIIILAVLLVLCSILLYSFESMSEQNQFKDGFSGIGYLLKIISGISGDAELEALQTLGGKVMVAIMILTGGCIVGVPIGIITSEFETMVKETTNQKEEENEDDLFLKFSETLTPEEKLEIIAKYHKETNKEEEKES